ncbi:MAG: sigma factor-like helix-turn-helix DNA-binding protein [Solirubrobacteraceae bacterium]
MASLETLPPDQRAVIDLVLQRGRSYDDIARLLAIDRAAVRARALAAFEAIGPETGISPESRALITDYLLGQLPDRVAEQTRERLAGSPYDRAWARVLASELGQVASDPLPEIPDGSRAAAAAPADGASSPANAAPGTRPARPSRSRRSREGGSRRPRLSDRPSSRRGGAIMLGVGVLVVIAVVVVLLAVIGGGSSSKHSPTTPAASSPTATSPSGATTTPGTTTTSGTTPKAQVVGQSNLNPPDGKGQAKGVAFVVKEGTAYGIVIEAAHVAPNNHNAYAAWLYNSPSDAYRLGFVSPAVGKSGQLQVGSPLPTNASHFKQLLLTVETQSKPTSPGTIVLQGPFSLTSTTG